MRIRQVRITKETDQFIVIDDFLPIEEFNQIQKEMLTLEYNKILLGDDIAYRIDSGDIFKSTRKYWRSTKEHFKSFFNRMEELPYIPSSDFSLMVHMYMPDAELSWHVDYSSKMAYSFYVHDKWESNWGGNLMICDSSVKDESEHNGSVLAHRQEVLDPGFGTYIMPLPNRLVIIKNGFHSVQPAKHRRESFTGFFK